MDLKKRIKDHIYRLDKGNHGNRYLQRSWIKHKGNFIFIIVEYITDVHNLHSREEYWINWCKNNTMGLYNIFHYVGKGSLGYNHTKESKRKISNASKGNTNRKGMKHTEETKNKMSLAHKGQIISEQHKLAISKKNKGRKFTKEHLMKLSESHKGYQPSKETRKKLSLANRGEKHSMAKLNEFQVRVIRRLCSFETLDRLYISGLFDISEGYISEIKMFKSWKYINQKGLSE